MSSLAARERGHLLQSPQTIPYSHQGMKINLIILERGGSTTMSCLAALCRQAGSGLIWGSPCTSPDAQHIWSSPAVREGSELPTLAIAVC